MKLLLLVALLSVLTCGGDTMAMQKTIGEKYMDFLKLFKTMSEAQLEKEVESLFAPNLKKVVNLRELSNNRADTFKQMSKVKAEYGLNDIIVYEYLETGDKQKCAIRWEISYDDGDVESVISVIKANAEGLIEEINEVFGQKGVYEWSAQ